MRFDSGEVEGVVVRKLLKNVDERGFLIETYRCDELPEALRPAMSYVSYTEPSVSRGPHEHTEQVDMFAFIGPGNFRLQLWDNRRESPSFGRKMVIFGGEDNPVLVVVPARVVHGYTNVSRTVRGMVINYPDSLYRGRGKTGDVDEIRHEDIGDEFFEDFR
jgi:dTDP-4-dehydrorhamnose 3,5-epimerase